MIQPGVDREAAARAIIETAKRGRPPTPRWVWLAALAVAAVCVGALAIGWLATDEDPATHAVSHPRAAAPSRNGFGAGVTVGFAAGVAVGAALWLRRR